MTLAKTRYSRCYTTTLCLMLIIIALAVMLTSYSNTLASKKTFNIPKSLSKSFIKPKIVKSKVKGYYIIKLPKTRYYLKPGAPIIPVKVLTFKVPLNYKLESFKVVGVVKEKIKGKYKILPTPQPVKIGEGTKKVIYKEDPKIYQSEKPYPSNIVEVEVKVGIDPITLSRVKYVIVRIFPVIYYPKKMEVEYVKSVNIDFTWQQTPIKLGSVSILDAAIVTSKTLESVALDLASFKNATGVRTKVFTTDWINTTFTGRDLQEKIRKFVNYSVNTYGIKYLIIFGDVDQVPARKIYSTLSDQGGYVETDLYYADLQGTWDVDNDGLYGEIDDDVWAGGVDGIPDVFFGRIPASSVTEAQIIVNKIKNYTPANSWFKKILFLGTITFGDEYHPEGEILKDYIEYNLSLGRIFCWTKLYEGIGNLTVRNVVYAINSGYGFVNFAGHGNVDLWWFGDGEYFLTSDVNSLNNSLMLPVVVAMSCLTGDYADTDICLGEMFLIRNGGGAIAYIGASDVAYGYVGDWILDGLAPEIDWRFFYNLKRFIDLGLTPILGQIHVETLTQYIQYHGFSDEYDWYTVAEYGNLLGDPTLKLAGTGTPPPPTPSPKLYGYVILPNGSLAKGAIVKVYRTFKYTTSFVGEYTATNGYYEFVNITWGLLNVTAYLNGKKIGSKVFYYPRVNMEVNITAATYKVSVAYPYKATISKPFPVKVYVKADGIPVSNATVKLYCETLNILLSQGVTDANGTVRLEAIINGTGEYLLNASVYVDSQLQGYEKFKVKMVSYNITYIENIPYNITSPGYYLVVGNLTSTTYGVLIAVSNVTLDIGRYTLEGSGGYSTDILDEGLKYTFADLKSIIAQISKKVKKLKTYEGIGIIAENVENIRIWNGTLKAWSTDGIEAYDINSLEVKDVSVLDYTDIYIYNGSNILFSNIKVDDIILSSVQDTALKFIHGSEYYSTLLCSRCSNVSVNEAWSWYSIYLYTSNDIDVENARLSYALQLSYSTRVKCINVTTMSGGIDIEGSTAKHYNSHIIENCRAAGKNVVYIVNSSGLNIDLSNAGEIIVASSSNIEGYNLNVNIYTSSIIVAFSESCEFHDCNISFSKIHITHSDYVTLRSMNLTRFDEIHVSYSSHVAIRDVKAQGIYRIELSLSKFITLQNVILDDTSEGLVIYGLSHEYWDTHTIEGCYVNNASLIYLRSARNVLVEGVVGQVIIASSRNVTVRDAIFTCENMIQAFFTNDTIFYNVTGGSRIRLGSCYNILISSFKKPVDIQVDMDIYNCLIYNMDVYDLILNGERNIISRNIIRGYVYIYGGRNIIYANEFKQAESITSYDTQRWYSTKPLKYIYAGKTYFNFTGNYYADYTGSDNNGDGIGDTPYVTEYVNDKYPLISGIGNYVLPEETFITVSAPETVLLNKAFNITIKLLYARNITGIVNAVILVYDADKNTLIGNLTTDEKGVAVLEGLCYNTTGIHRIKVVYEGEDWILNRTLTFEVKVVKSVVFKFNVSDVDIIKGYIKLNISLYCQGLNIIGAEYAIDNTDNPIRIPEPIDGAYDSNNETVHIEVNGKEYSLGIHIIYIKIIGEGNYISDWFIVKFNVRQLYKDYNLIALSLKPFKPLRASMLKRIIGDNFVAVWEWLPDKQAFHGYVPGVSGPQDDFELRIGYGYFIFMSKPEIWVEVGE